MERNRSNISDSRQKGCDRLRDCLFSLTGPTEPLAVSRTLHLSTAGEDSCKTMDCSDNPYSCALGVSLTVGIVENDVAVAGFRFAPAGERLAAEPLDGFAELVVRETVVEVLTVAPN